MIIIREFNSDTFEYEEIGRLTDDREFITGEKRLTRSFPKEWWETADLELILDRFSNGRIIATHEESGSEESEPTPE